MTQARRKKAAAAAKRAAARERDLQALRDISDDVIESDFVPYACLFDPETIVSKNGELLQVIRITGHQQNTGEARDLRAALRAAIAAHVPNASYAMWLHTVRRRQITETQITFPDPFADQVNARWRNQHPASASFTNELTITLVKAGQPANLTNVNALQQSLLPLRDRRVRMEYLEQSRRELGAITKKFLDTLAPYGARLLTTVERNGVFYGEHLEFLEKLINLEDRPMPVPRRDLSFALTSGDITFGFNAMEVRNSDGKRKFAALMTVKEYKESTLKGIDQFLEIPCELIVTQCFDFIDADRAQEAYEKQAEYLRISGDKELASWMEIDRLTSEKVTGTRAFGQQQTSIFLIAPSVKQLETNVRMVQKAFARLGMVVVREDLRIEECYWAQLPANFPFLSRHRFIDTHHLAGFTNLQPAPMGTMAGSPWGPPVSLLKTINDAPYYFNFHRGHVAHTLLLGRKPADLAVTGHFLVAQARKLPITIWMLDGTGRGAAFTKALNGVVSTPATPSLKLNPLQLNDNPANRDFLAVWLSTLADPNAAHLNRTSLEFFQSLVTRVMQLPIEQRRLSNLLPIVRQEDGMLANQLQRWCAGGTHGELFDMPRDEFTADTLQCWNLSAFATDEAVRIPLVSYLLQRLTGMLSGKPTLIVLNEALQLLNTPLFSSRVPAWLDFLSSNNAACMALCTDIAHASSYPYARALSNKAASIFILPDHDVDAEYMLGFDLNETDLAAVVHMNAARHDVLLKRGGESTMLKLDLSALEDLYSRLAGNPELSPKDQLAALMAGAA